MIIIIIDSISIIKQNNHDQCHTKVSMMIITSHSQSLYMIAHAECVHLCTNFFFRKF